MKDLIELTNLLITNSILVKSIVFAIISEAIIYFGIRNNTENRFFNIGIFIAIQIAINTIFNEIKYISTISGIIVILISCVVIFILNNNDAKSFLMQTRTLLLMNGWDTLGKTASLVSPVVIRITFKNEEEIYGVFADKSNISFANNKLGIFLEKIMVLDDDGNLVINDESEGFWVSDSDIFMIELVKRIEKI